MHKKPATLVLTEDNIKQNVDMRTVLSIVERAFALHGAGKVQMPPKIYLTLPKYNGDFRAMPAYLEGMEACGIKWVNVHPSNRKRGLPVVMALIVLNDPRTGFPLAIMDGTYITSLRTGASGAVAAWYLANKDSSRIGFVGCGNQAIFQLAALVEKFRVRQISVYDTDTRQAWKFARLARRWGHRVTICKNIKDAVLSKDIVVTTTPSRKPIIKTSWISPGTHMNAIGADAKGKQELEAGILKKAKIIVDDPAQAVHSGEINVPIAKKIIRESDIYASLGQIVSGKKEARRRRDEITVFDSTGLAIQDIAVASCIYKTAVTGRRLNILTGRECMPGTAARRTS